MFQPIDLFNIYNNLLEFINFRNLNLIDKIYNKDEFEQMINMDNYFKIETDKMTIILIHYNEYINSKFILEFLKKNKSTKETIIVTEKVISKNLPPDVKNYFYKHFRIIVPNHILVPKYKILTEEECDILLKKQLICKKSEMQNIYSNDAMMIWIGANPGDIVSEEIKLETSGNNIEYKLVKKQL
jgi:DNA-directed RNA polymerase subunit H (RpoH/RPB5)